MMNALTKIEEQKQVYLDLKKTIDAELRQLRSDKLRNAKLEYAKSVLDAWNTGMQNVSALARAMGTSDRKSVYDLLALARSVSPGSVQIAKGERNWKALVSVAGARVSVVDVPPAWWTYEVKDRRPNRPKAPWSGWVEFDLSWTYIAQTDASPSPLQAEWMFGDGTLREAVDL